MTHLFLLLTIHNTFLCRGCSKDFCFDHLIQHRQFLNEQLGLIQDDYNQLRQNLLDLRNNPLKHPSIDQWENGSIPRIKEKANEYRQILINYTNESINQIERKLNEQLYQSITACIKQKSNSFINEISIRFTSMSKFFSNSLSILSDVFHDNQIILTFQCFII